MEEKNTRSSLPPSSLPLPPFFCPRGPAWSGRLPVTQESVGSNPIEGARGKVRKQAKRRSSNLRDFVGSTPTLATPQRDVFPAAGCKPAVTKQAGWRRMVQFLHVSSVTKKSLPRWSIGRTPGSQPGTAGSIPARGTHGRVVELADTRRSERRAARRGSSNLLLVTKNRRAAGKARGEEQHLSEWQASRLGLISPVPLGSNPGLATPIVGYANWQSGQVESLASAGSTPAPTT